jgi:hypothetical protein
MENDEDHLLEMCSRSIRRLREMSELDPIPQVLVRGEADLLEKYVVELKLHRAAADVGR